MENETKLLIIITKIAQNKIKMPISSLLAGHTTGTSELVRRQSLHRPRNSRRPFDHKLAQNEKRGRAGQGRAGHLNSSSIRHALSLKQTLVKFPQNVQESTVRWVDEADFHFDVDVYDEKRMLGIFRVVRSLSMVNYQPTLQS